MHFPIPDPAPVTKAVLPSRRISTSPLFIFSSLISLWYNSVRLRPAKPIFSARLRFVFAADPALVAELVDRLERNREIHLAGIGLVARRHGRDLHMADQRQIFFETLEQIAAGDLQMIEV